MRKMHTQPAQSRPQVVVRGQKGQTLYSTRFHPQAKRLVEEFLPTIGLHGVDGTCRKDLHMIELWDDSAVHVIKNTALRADGEL